LFGATNGKNRNFQVPLETPKEKYTSVPEHYELFKPVGQTNHGNSCFANSLVQALATILPDVEEPLIDKQDEVVLTSNIYNDFILAALTGTNRPFYDAIFKDLPNWKNRRMYSQYDATILLRDFLSYIAKEKVAVPFLSMFTFQVAKFNEGCCSEAEDPKDMRIISLQSPEHDGGVGSIQKSVNAWFKIECMECENDGFLRREVIGAQPQFLIVTFQTPVHASAFSSSSFNQNTEFNFAGKRYELVAVNMRHPFEGTSGHYTSVVRVKSSPKYKKGEKYRWWSASDSSVYPESDLPYDAGASLTVYKLVGDATKEEEDQLKGAGRATEAGRKAKEAAIAAEESAAREVASAASAGQAKESESGEETKSDNDAKIDAIKVQTVAEPTIGDKSKDVAPGCPFHDQTPEE
ncbi:UNVERIFIED_CONTAM: hypothetical protein HDU68_006764, partial [Siphonaria sp. JEL0065]